MVTFVHGADADVIVATPYQPSEEEINEFMYRMVRDGLDKPIDQRENRSLFVCRYERRPGGYSTDLSCGTNQSWNYVRDLMLIGLTSSGYGGMGSGPSDKADDADFIFTMRSVSRRQIQEKIDYYSVADSEQENREKLLRLVLLFLVGVAPETSEISNEQIVSFSLAYVAVNATQEKFDPRIAAAVDAQEKQRLIEESDQKMIRAITESGLSIEAYNQLASALHSDSIFLDAVKKATAILEELQWTPE